jgi:hypothetical protein
MIDGVTKFFEARLTARQIKLIKATATAAAIVAIPFAADMSAASFVANINP